MTDDIEISPWKPKVRLNQIMFIVKLLPEVTHQGISLASELEEVSFNTNKASLIVRVKDTGIWY
ncbi:hypothetical protein OK016_20215 [Vibrio chagasii]|nr:hypothetical protein [Vibrio chagasii]